MFTKDLGNHPRVYNLVEQRKDSCSFEEKIAINALMSGLLLENLYYALAKDPLRTMTELMAKASKIMNTEEPMATKQAPGYMAEGHKSYEKKDKKDKKA